MAIIKWNKNYGETLSETLSRFKKEKPKFLNEKVTYAGRLDPMAEGLVLLLTGIDVHRKEEFLKLDKSYFVDFVFGPDTDTYDILGVLSDKSVFLEKIDEKRMNNILNRNIGSFRQKYPPFSSKTVNGKPLFLWAKEKLLSSIEIPSKLVYINDIKYIGFKEVSSIFFQKQVISSIKSVNGDFRQEEILKAWDTYFSNNPNIDTFLYRIKVDCSSGVYMRSLIHRIGDEMNIPACSVKIKRVRIGEYFL